MKRLIIICMLIMCLLPLSTAGKDKIKMICSPLGGYSMLPESEYQISYMNPDGSVKWEKLNRMLQEIANTGAFTHVLIIKSFSNLTSCTNVVISITIGK